MKKINYLFVGLMAATALAGCGKKDNSSGNSGFDPEDYNYVPKNITGGTEDEQLAIVESTNLALCTKNGVTEIVPEDNFEFIGIKNDYVQFTTSQAVFLNGESYTVQIEWDVDEAQGELSVVDDHHKKFEFNFPKKGEQDGVGSWSIKSMTCGGASTTNPEVAFSGKLVALTGVFEEHTIAEINAVTDGKQTIDEKTFPSTFDILNYEYVNYEGKHYPFFEPNGTDGSYSNHFARIVGQVVYYSPDGNFALIADGDEVLELYAGSGQGTPLLPEKYPLLTVGNYIAAEGHMDQYCGNMQMCYVTKIGQPTQEEKDRVQAWTGKYAQLEAAEIAAFKSTVSEYGYEKQAFKDGFMNSFRAVTGTLVPGSIKDKNSNTVQPSAIVNNRFSFELQVGDETMLVAYDYHTCKSKENTLFDDLVNYLKVGGEITIQGTMRYSGNDASSFYQNDTGARWSIVPLTPANLVIAE